MSKFTDFDFHPKIIEAVSNLGYESPTPIQEGSFKALLNGRDFLGIAQTGGGKTGAFVIPILQRLSQSNMPAAAGFPRAVILSPTRELALQILEAVHSLSKGMGIRQTCIYGGAPFRPQINALNQSQDIIVATPGRLMDHVRRGNIRFDDTEILVLDEADRMLDMGFLNDVKEISEMLPKEHQTIMFSATANKQIRSLVPKLLKDFDTVEIEGTTALPETISHKLIYVTMRNKDALLLDVLRSGDMEQAVVFTRTKMQADKVADWLKDNDIRSDAIHGDKKQNVRTRILNNFRNGRTAVLVATDVAARGIDVEAVTHVVNYNMPMEAENYVHRVGRTGRAGRSGIAFSFCDGGDTALLRDVERFIDMKIEIDDSSEYALDPADIAKLPSPKRGGGGGRGRGGNGGGRGGNGGGRGGRDGGRSFGGERRNDSRGGRDGGRSFGGERRSGGRDGDSRGGERRSFGDKPSFGGNRDNRNDSRGGRDGGRSFGGERRDDNRSEGRNERRSFGDKPSFGGNRDNRNDSRGGRDGGRSFGGEKRNDNRGEGRNERRSFGDKPSFGGNRDNRNDSRGGRDGGRSFGGERRSGGRDGDSRGGERRSFGDKPSFGGNRDNRNDSRGGRDGGRSFGGEKRNDNRGSRDDGGFSNDRSSFGGNNTRKNETRDNSGSRPALKPRSAAAKAGAGMKRRTKTSVSRAEGFRKRVRTD